jgi:aspartyl-tRNA synthetase
MMIKMDFFTQVCDIIDGLFVSIFKHLTTNCKKELETINGQYPFEPLKVNIIVCSVVPTICYYLCPLALITDSNCANYSCSI